MDTEGQANRQVLLISAKPELHGMLRERLAAADLYLAAADSSSAAWGSIFQHSLHAVVIDLTSAKDPEVWNLCRACAELSQAPVIGLISAEDERSRVLAFACGVDQCFVPPVGLAELVTYLTVHPVFHRSPRSGDVVKSIPETLSLVVDLERRRVFRNRRPVSLSRIEFALLLLLARRGEQVVETDDIRRALWKSRRLSPGMVKQYIWRLRCKIEPDPGHPVYLETVRGLGYCLHHSSVIPAANQEPLGI